MTIIKDYGETHASLPTAQDEYVFSRVTPTGESQEFVVCDVFLETVLEAGQPDHDGWHGILLEYHVNMSWLDQPWVIPDIPSLLLALRSVPPEAIAEKPFGAAALRILLELLDFLGQAEDVGQQVILSKR